MKKLYPENPYQYFTEIRTVATNSNTITSPQISNMISTEDLLTRIKQQWGDQSLATFEVKNPNTDQAVITIKQLEDRSITLNQPQIVFDGTGKILSNTRNNSAIATLNAGVYGLHMATFAQPFLRFAFFCSGVLGCLMIASGLLLWSLKRQIQYKSPKFHFGYYLVDRLNIASFIGLPIAMLSYFLVNRLISSHSADLNHEIYTFFSVWMLSFVLALFTPKQYLWKSQIVIFALLAFSLPLYNLFYLLNHDLIANLESYWLFLRVDLFFVACACFAAFIYKNIQPIQIKSTQKIKSKLIKNGVNV